LSVKNLVPLPYRRVSVQSYDGPMTAAALRAHLLGREAYRRTEFVVLRQGAATAVVQISAADRQPLFSPVQSAEVLALPDACLFAEDGEVDVANPSALAAKARALGVGPEGTLVLQGRYGHVNLIHRPDPLVVRVVEVTPPHPPKLYDMARHVLSYAELPPIRLELEQIDLNQLALEAGRGQPVPPAYLVPCRSGGLDRLPAPVYFLDQRPERHPWTMIGCERSLQFHRHYYGDEPPRVELCPRQLAGRGQGAPADKTLVKCCLLEFHVEQDDQVAVVPWGADLKMVEDALRALSGARPAHSLAHAPGGE
jgi:hypothetical protein